MSGVWAAAQRRHQGRRRMRRWRVSALAAGGRVIKGKLVRKGVGLCAGWAGGAFGAAQWRHQCESRRRSRVSGGVVAWGNKGFGGKNEDTAQRRPQQQHSGHEQEQEEEEEEEEEGGCMGRVKQGFQSSRGTLREVGSHMSDLCRSCPDALETYPSPVDELSRQHCSLSVTKTFVTFPVDQPFPSLLPTPAPASISCPCFLLMPLLPSCLTIPLPMMQCASLIPAQPLTAALGRWDGVWGGCRVWGLGGEGGMCGKKEGRRGGGKVKE